jgi:S-formylglutathione hydrolase FrmB
MILILPDGDNGFYTDENEGKALFPHTKNREGGDDFYQGEALNYSLFPFLYMKPGALGKHESYLLELIQHIDTHSSYRERVLQKKGVGGFSMGGFGAIKLALKYPHRFHSVSSQSGLIDIELLKNKWMLKMVLPEFLEIFGHLEAKRLPPNSTLDQEYIRTNNPISLMKARGIKELPQWLYFDYGEKESFEGVVQGNQNLEKLLKEKSHRIPRQPFNGKSEHNYQFWRSRSGNILQHHSNIFRNVLPPPQ